MAAYGLSGFLADVGAAVRGTLPLAAQSGIASSVSIFSLSSTTMRSRNR